MESLEEYLNRCEAEQAPYLDGTKKPEQGVTPNNIQQQEQPPVQPEQPVADNVNTQATEEPQEKEYQKLGWGVIGDTAKTLGAEALKIAAPKDGSWLANATGNRWTESNLYHHEAQTRTAEALKYLYRYGASTAAISFAMYATGGAITPLAEAQLAKNATGLAGVLAKAGKPTGQILQFLSKEQKLFKGGSKLAQLGNYLTQYGASSIISDYAMYRPEDEGHMLDAVFREGSYLNSSTAKPEIVDRGINVAEGMVGAAALKGTWKGLKGLWKGALNLNEKYLQIGTKKLANKETAEEGAGEVLTTLKNIKNLDDLHQKDILAQDIIEASETTGQSIDELLSEVPLKNRQEVSDLINVYQSGEEPFIHSDGTWDIKVSNWEDAHKVSPEEYSKQLSETDANLGLRAGDTAISHQDEAVKSTWQNRGWLGTNETDTGLLDKQGFVSQKTAQNITNKYLDKWGIKNKVKVEVVDGLAPKGQAVEGYTKLAETQGKKMPKSLQNKIDKQNLKITKLQDKLTMLEGGNAPVTDEVDLVREELRIAKNELSDLQKEAKGKTIAKNITIYIDKNAPNPYATLRGELEHSRDMALDTTPKHADVAGSGKHFSRYVGDNEGEVAPNYTYKKSEGRAKALEGQQVANNTLQNEVFSENVKQLENSSLQNDMNPSQVAENSVKYNQENIDGQRTDTETTTTIKDSETENGTVRQSSREISRNDSQRGNGTRLFIQRNDVWVVDTNSKNTFNNGKTSKIGYKELSQDAESGNSFYNAISQAKANLGDLGASVHTYTPEEYSQMKMFLSEDGLSGFAIKPDGDIVSVFSNPNAKINDFRRRGHAMVELAKEQGGIKLDAFDTYLPDFYKKHGFEETGRDVWNEQYKPENWNKDFYKEYNNGEPDVVYMTLKEEKLPITEPQQLKIDFNTKVITEAATTDDVVNGVVNGEIKLDSKEAVDTFINKTITSDIEISGNNWRAAANDADSYLAQRLSGEYGDIDSIQTAFNNGDVKTVETLARKMLAVGKITGELVDRLNLLKNNGDLTTQYNIQKAIETLALYDKKLGSAFGRVLNLRKLSNQTREVFSDGVGQTSQYGITNIVDVLDTQIKALGLAFTRGEKINLNQVRRELYNALEQVDDGKFMQEYGNNKDVISFINDLIDNIKEDPQGLSKGELLQRLVNAIEADEIRDKSLMLGLCDNIGKVKNTLLNWGRGLKDIAINNVLGIATFGRGTISGISTGLFNPISKYMGSFLMPMENGTEVRAFTMNQIKGAWANWSDCCQLALQACKNGEGALTSTKKVVEGEFTDSLQSLDWSNLGNGIKSLFTLIPHLMVGSDEFIKQLNYRGIMSAKITREIEEKYPNITNSEFDEIFQELWQRRVFTSDGKPLDTDAFAEVSELTFQSPLDGQYWNRATGQYDTPEGYEQGLWQKMGEAVQNFGKTFPLFSMFQMFVRTPFNVAQFTSDHTLGMFSERMLKRMASSDPVVAAKARGEVAVIGLGFTGAILAGMSGNITGAGSLDPKERAAMKKAGWQPYSIKVGNKWVSYQGWGSPFDMILGLAADWSDAVVNFGENREVEGTFKTLAKTLVQAGYSFIDNVGGTTGFVDGMGKFIDAINPSASEKTRMQAIAGLIQAEIPLNATFRNLTNTGGREEKQANGFYEQIAKNILPLKMDYKRDIFGERVTKASFLGVFSSTDDKSSNIEYKEMQNLAEQYGWTPSNTVKYVLHTKVPLKEFKNPETNRTAYDYTLEQMSTTTIGGKTLRESLRELFQSPEYKALPFKEEGSSLGVPTKQKMINQIYKMYGDQAYQEVITGELPFVNKEGQTMDEARATVNYKTQQGILETLQQLY